MLPIAGASTVILGDHQVAPRTVSPREIQTTITLRHRLRIMGDDRDQPEIIECKIQLHSDRPASSATGEPSTTDWSKTAVSEAVTFRAIAIVSQGAWNGPLSPGIEIAAPVPLENPYWTVSLPASKGVPVLVGQVGRRLGIGETFKLPPGEPGVWTEDVVFEGAIVIE
jgi:hypothetical protein